MAEPRPVAPRMPASYGVPTDGSGADSRPWSWAVERLRAARTYWLSTTRTDGRPHAAPVWGLWLDGAVWFSTALSSLKARNLARDSRAVVHTESGDEVVILEGDARPVDSPGEIEAFLDAYDVKYALRPDLAALEAGVFRLRPASALTWDEHDFTGTAARWVFDR